MIHRLDAIRPAAILCAALSLWLCPAFAPDASAQAPRVESPSLPVAAPAASPAPVQVAPTRDDPSASVPAELDPTWPVRGRFLIGLAWGTTATVDRDLGTQYKVSPFFRWNSRRSGWGPSFGLSWYNADLRVPVDGVRRSVGTVKTRPVMAGLGYSWVKNRTRTTLGVVGGYVFNRTSVDRQLPPGYQVSVEMKNAWAGGPKADLMVAVSKRFVVSASTAYVYSHPDVVTTVR